MTCAVEQLVRAIRAIDLDEDLVAGRRPRRDEGGASLI
jgi:hypothetical protein